MALGERDEAPRGMSMRGRWEAQEGVAGEAGVGGQGLKEDPGSMDRAEAGGAGAPRVVGAADGLKSARGLARHDAASALERGSDHVRGDLVAARKSRRVAVVEVSAAPPRGSDDAVYVFHRVEAPDRLFRRFRGFGQRHPAVKAARTGAAPERALPVYRQRMAFGKAVAPKLRAKEQMRRHARPAR